MATQKLDVTKAAAALGIDLNNLVSETPKLSKGKQRSINTAEAYKRYPKHLVEMSAVCANNNAIRFFTSKGIIALMIKDGLLSPSKKHYVNIGWTKFSIITDGLKNEYPFTNKYFIKAFAASFTVLSNRATMALNNYIEVQEGKSLLDVLTKEDIEETANLVTKATSENEDVEVATATKE